MRRADRRARHRPGAHRAGVGGPAQHPGLTPGGDGAGVARRLPPPGGHGHPPDRVRRAADDAASDRTPCRLPPHASAAGWSRWVPARRLVAVIPPDVVALGVSRRRHRRSTICMVGWPARSGLIASGDRALAASSRCWSVTPNLFGSIVGLFAGAPEDPSITSRTDSFDLPVEFIAPQPLFGRGLGTFLPKYRIFDNQYLVLLVTIGIVGTLAFVALGVTRWSPCSALRRAFATSVTATWRLSLVRRDVRRFRQPVHLRRLRLPDDDGRLVPDGSPGTRRGARLAPTSTVRPQWRQRSWRPPGE